MFRISLFAIFLFCSTLTANESRFRNLFDFKDPQSKSQWKPVNDVVMGGRSQGRIAISNRDTMEFSGSLSLENNGGFASVRSLPKELAMNEGDSLVTRIRGDGRQYTLNLYVPSGRNAFSYRVTIETQKDQWMEVHVPLDQFVATSFGRTVRNAGPVDPRQVNSIGFLIGDKKVGPFRLEVDWIRIEPQS